MSRGADGDPRVCSSAPELHTIGGRIFGCLPRWLPLESKRFPPKRNVYAHVHLYNFSKGWYTRMYAYNTPHVHMNINILYVNLYLVLVRLGYKILHAQRIQHETCSRIHTRGREIQIQEEREREGWICDPFYRWPMHRFTVTSSIETQRRVA